MNNVKLTRHGICYNLDSSPYIFEKEYNCCKVQYNFSSENYVSKFNDYMNDTLEVDKRVLKNESKYGLKFDIPLIEDIKKYKQIEKRGFYIVIEGKGYRSINEVKVEIVFFG